VNPDLQKRFPRGTERKKTEEQNKNLKPKYRKKKKGESHGLVVKADGSRSRGRGFESRHCILDGCKQC